MAAKGGSSASFFFLLSRERERESLEFGRKRSKKKARSLISFFFTCCSLSFLSLPRAREREELFYSSPGSRSPSHCIKHHAVPRGGSRRRRRRWRRDEARVSFRRSMMGIGQIVAALHFAFFLSSSSLLRPSLRPRFSRRRHRRAFDAA